MCGRWCANFVEHFLFVNSVACFFRIESLSSEEQLNNKKAFLKNEIFSEKFGMANDGRKCHFFMCIASILCLIGSHGLLGACSVRKAAGTITVQVATSGPEFFFSGTRSACRHYAWPGPTSGSYREGWRTSLRNVSIIVVKALFHPLCVHQIITHRYHISLLKRG